jgi:hypothetical protein
MSAASESLGRPDAADRIYEHIAAAQRTVYKNHGRE